MTGVDWIIVAFAALLASFGFRRGFIVGVLSFAGFALGAFVGTRLGPLVLPDGSSSPYAPAFGLLGALLAGAILASGLEGVGLRVRRALVIPGLGLLDGVLGAALGAALGLGIVWILAAVAAQAPNQSQLRADIQRSSILRELNVLLPPTGPLLNALARLDPLPHLTGPSANVPAPLPQSAAAPGVRRAAPSVVRVLGTACGLAIEGSGWVAEPETVVTNAHVVAGEDDTTVEVGGRQPQLPAQPIAFDPIDDVAVLHVSGLALPALALAQDPASGTPGAILGYPENGPFDARPARIGRTQSVDTQDAYGRGPVTRLLTPLVGVVHPGNSGGPLVGSDGRVLATVFAGTVGASTPGGYGVANSSVAAVLAQAQAHERAGLQAGTEGCANG
ncbi:MAG TPA: MarP family serine protease [Solirubrobacteraceae bacterium]|nr:MarP family serine protease [Solirubrobacteraceae bacterium]